MASQKGRPVLRPLILSLIISGLILIGGVILIPDLDMRQILAKLLQPLAGIDHKIRDSGHHLFKAETFERSRSVGPGRRQRFDFNRSFPAGPSGQGLCH